MTMPEDVERDLPPGGLLPARNILDPGLFCQAVYCPELRPGKSHNWPWLDAFPDGLLWWPDSRVTTLDSENYDTLNLHTRHLSQLGASAVHTSNYVGFRAYEPLFASASSS